MYKIGDVITYNGLLPIWWPTDSPDAHWRTLKDGDKLIVEYIGIGMSLAEGLKYYYTKGGYHIYENQIKYRNVKLRRKVVIHDIIK